MAELSKEELEQIVRQLEAEEVSADDARLSSVESLQLWMQSHPALRQMAVVEHMAQLGPAILQAIRALLGL